MKKNDITIDKGNTLIYLGAPYSHSQIAIMKKRLYQIDKFTSELINKGYHVFSPISHSGHIAFEFEMPTDFKFWEENCKIFLDRCDLLYVYNLPGWKDSVGLRTEMEYFSSNEKLILHSDNYELK